MSYRAATLHPHSQSIHTSGAAANLNHWNVLYSQMCAEPAVSPVEDPLLSPLLGGAAGFPQGHLEPEHPSGHAVWLPGPPKGAPLGPAVPLVPVLVPGFPGGSNASREAALQCLPLLCVRFSAVLR